MTGSPSPARPSNLGLWSATALVVGHTIGVGVFLTPSQLLGALGSPAWTLGLWFACGALVLAGALTFGELASRHPRSGGLYVYLREGYGPRAGFLYGWQALLVMDPGVTASLALGAAEYVGVLWPGAAGHPKGVALGAIWILAGLSLADLRLGARAMQALTALKILAIAGIVAAALLCGSGDPTHFLPFWSRGPGAPPLTEALGLGLVGVFFSFGGFWEASRVAGEVRSPERTVPRALVLGVALVTSAYAAVTAAFVFLVPIGTASGPADLARRAGAAMFGSSGPAILSAGVVLSVVGSLTAFLLMAPRLYVAMARDGLFPASLARSGRSSRAPRRATAVLAATASVLVLTGGFSQVVAFFLCPALALLGLAASTIFRERRRGPPAPFAAPGYPATPVLFLLFLGLVVAAIAVARPAQALAGLALSAAGLPFHDILRSRGKLRARDGEDTR